MKTKKVVALMLAVSMIGTLTACGGSGDTKSTQSTGGESAQSTEAVAGGSTETAEATNDETSTPRNETLYFAGQQWGTINDWNPLSSNSNNGLGINQSGVSRDTVYETLFMYNMLDGKLYGLLGKDYAWNDDQTELTVHLNPDAKWNDGTQVTAEDVKYTFDTHVKYQSGVGSDFSIYIDSVDAPDAETIVFHSKLGDDGKPLNPLKVIEFIPKVYIMQKAYLQTVEERNNNDANAIKTDAMEDCVSSGPYKRFYNDDQKVILKRDDNYWGQADSMWGKLPAPKYLAHVIYKDNAAGTVALKNGDVDVAQMFVENVQNLWLEDNLPISTYMDEAPYGICAAMPTIWFNTRKEGLDQKEVRKAIAMAVDFDQINQAAMTGQSPTFTEVPRSLMNATDTEQNMVDKDALKDHQFNGNDVEGAKKLLDDAGIVDTDGDGIREYPAGNNLSFKAECPEGWSDWNATLEIVAAAGKNIGIDISTYFPDSSTWMEDQGTANFDILMATPNGTTGIACPWVHCNETLSSDWNDLEVNNTGNFGRFQNDRADELLKLIPREQDSAKLKEYYTELSQIYLDEVPSFTAMYRPAAFHIVNESVWTNYPQKDDGSNVPLLDCTDGYGIAALYNLTLVEE